MFMPVTCQWMDMASGFSSVFKHYHDHIQCNRWGLVTVTVTLQSLRGLASEAGLNFFVSAAAVHSDPTNGGGPGHRNP